MALTPQQLPALKAAIAAATDPDFVFARENGQTGVMAALFNGATEINFQAQTPVVLA